jgi:hypothetical protein
VIVYVLTASPALMNMSTWWGAPMSAAHVIEGEGQLYLLLLLGVISALVLRGTVPSSSAGLHRTASAAVAVEASATR